MTTLATLRRSAVLAAALIPLATAPSAESWTTVAPAEAGFAHDRLQRLTDVMQGCVESGDVPGMVILILRDGRAVYHEAFGHADIESGAPMERDTIFRIAS